MAAGLKLKLAPKARMVNPAAGRPAMVEIDETFDRAWRRVGLALDRVGFTVEDRNRQQGVYFVRYVDPDKDGKKGEKSFLSRLFSLDSSKDDARKNAPQYRVAVLAAGDGTQVSVQNKDGAPENSDTSGRILNLLYDQLK